MGRQGHALRARRARALGSGVDFVVAGFGLGSLAVLAGILLADRGAFWRPGRDPAALARSARARGLGRVLAVGGGVLIGLTAIGLLLPGGDRAGTILVALGAAALALAAAGWAFGAFGRTPVRAAPPARPAEPRTAGARPQQRPPRRQPVPRQAAQRPVPPRPPAPILSDLPDPDEPDWPDAGDPLAWHDDPIFAPPRPAADSRPSRATPTAMTIAAAASMKLPAPADALPDPSGLPWPGEPGLDADADGLPDPFPPRRPRSS